MRSKLKSEIEIKFLADCPEEYFLKLAKLWQEEIGKHWAQNESIDQKIQRFTQHANKDKLPLMLVAIKDDQPIGMACLRISEGIKLDLIPWLGGLVISPEYRKSPVLIKLANNCFDQAKKLGYSTIYLVAFDKRLAKKYERILNCNVIGTDYIHDHPVAVLSFNI